MTLIGLAFTGWDWIGLDKRRLWFAYMSSIYEWIFLTEGSLSEIYLTDTVCVFRQFTVRITRWEETIQRQEKEKKTKVKSSLKRTLIFLSEHSINQGIIFFSNNLLITSRATRPSEAPLVSFFFFFCTTPSRHSLCFITWEVAQPPSTPSSPPTAQPAPTLPG